MKAAWLVLAACSGASPDPGLDARLQIPGAQFRPGPFPADAGGPAALSLIADHANVVIDHLHDKLVAVLDHGATAAAFGLPDVDGTWLLPAGLPAFDTPGEPNVDAFYGFGAALEPGPTTIIVAAADATGRFGAAAQTMVIAAPDDPPAGELVVGLEWDGTADLDIHVIDPLGGEAWSQSPNTWQPPPPGEVPPPDAFKMGGILNHDGNMGCHHDARPNEYVVWTMPPPPGGYLVRVDVHTLCGGPEQPWYVAAYRSGNLIGAVRGISTEDDVENPHHGAGAGVVALQFTLP